MAIKKGIAKIEVLAREIEFHGAREFFDFFSSYYIDFWIIDAMPRKLNGERGAPIAGLIEWKRKLKDGESEIERKTYFPFKKPFGSKLVLWNLQKLLAYLITTGKRNIDMHIKESPINGQYHRTILIDDLNCNQVDLLENWWSGPLAIIETSGGNYQAILVVMDRYGLSSIDKLIVARELAHRFDGDNGAVATNQFHRFPGSSNNKLTVLDGSLPFICRLTSLRESVDGRDGSECIVEMIQSAADRNGEAGARTRRKPGRTGEVGEVVIGRDETPSGQAFRWTLRALRSGMQQHQLEQGLLRWVGDHEQADWIQRTIFNARSILAGSDTRYRA